GLVGTRSAEERPALQHQWAAAEATEDGGAEPACAPPPTKIASKWSSRERSTLRMAGRNVPRQASSMIERQSAMDRPAPYTSTRHAPPATCFSAPYQRHRPSSVGLAPARCSTR